MQLIIFFLAVLICVILTPIARVIAKKLNILDSPNTDLKKHREPIPYLGGVAIFAAIVISMAIFEGDSILMLNDQQRGLLLGTLIILLIGLIDDMKGMTPKIKLVLQLFAAYIVWFHGISFSLFDHWYLNMALTLIWVAGLSNAFNLIDIMDGLAAGIAAICSLFLALLLLLSGDPFHSTLMIVVSGSCLGFLIFNFKPAKIYLGDTGSLLLGFLLACTVANWAKDQQLNHHFIVPILILGIPIFELFFVSILRIKAGKSPLLGSPDHFALRLIRMGFSVKRTVVLTYVCSIAFGAIGFLILFFHNFTYSFVALILAFVCFAAHRLSQVKINKA
ncbi:MraY family glycosyltransferase [Paenibacillus chondroitinus]|uniref:MraY family glycosyltransferase n=1 Tax=Paenibacillus chondroitinus TaxID=59842 RepID=A0ABU6DKD1_9BACL|nr:MULTISPECIES: MraY family glycosyltransferase [Paenibacillus]MCY9660970.1 undecaprenyl/decaprenyl-phosphate alpha-N-acetylglucosaminyl 1-phosphate transferase [Paenibacillus anseongense]MEB4797971.1 MraY family glycosyltransferase [Paenibacillus chondroitinus]